MSDARSNLLTRGMHDDGHSINGVRFEWDGDWYHVSGTATGDIGWSAYRSAGLHLVPGKTYTLSVSFDGDVPSGYSRSLFQLFAENKYKTIATAWPGTNYATFTVPDGDYERFQIWGPIIKGGATVDTRVRWMLVEGDTPAAWAPAEGEGLAGGGCSDER